MDGQSATISTPFRSDWACAWQRMGLAFVIGLAAGLAVIIRHHTQLQPTGAETFSWMFASGFVAMLTTGALQLSHSLWSKGALGSVLAILLFGLGSVAAISLICFISVVAFSA